MVAYDWFIEANLTGGALEFQDGTAAQFMDGTAITVNGRSMVNITSDVLLGEGIRARIGIRGNGVGDRIAGPGQLTFSLKNGANNSAGLLGYYSPNNANCRDSWTKDILIQAGFNYNNTRYVKFYGWIKSIEPQMGLYGDRAVRVVVKDYVEQLMQFADTNVIDLQTDVCSGDVYTALLAQMPVQPKSTDIDDCGDIMEYALHGAVGENPTAFSEVLKVARSVFDYVFVDEEGIFTTQGRQSRLATTYIVADQNMEFQNGDLYHLMDGGALIIDASFVASGKTLNNTMSDLEVKLSSDNQMRKIAISTYPVEKSNGAVTVYTLEEPIMLRPGASYTFTARYRAADSDTPVGLENPETQVADTHYKFGSAKDEDSGDLNEYLTITISYGATAAEVVLSSSSTVVGWVNKFEITGTSLKTVRPVTVENENTSVNNSNVERLNLPYQHSSSFGVVAGDFTRNVYGSSDTAIDTVSYMASKSDALMETFLETKLGQPVTLVEPVIGVNRANYINAVDWEIEDTNSVRVKYIVAKARAENSTWNSGVWGSDKWVFAGG